MSKGRMIDRKIRSSQTFASFTYRQRDLWQGLIEVADDQGRMPGHPAYVRSVIWPYDDILLSDVDADLNALADAGNILRYTVDGSRYIQIVNWHIYQSGTEWLGLSNYPAPNGWIDHARYHSKGNKVETLNWESRTSPPTSLPTSLPASLPSRDGEGDVKGDVEVEGEVEGDAEDGPLPLPLPKSTAKTIPAILARSAGLSAIPPDEMKRIEQITCLIETHGADRVEESLKDAFQKWKATKNKNGKPYPVTNMGWVDWAQQELDTGTTGASVLTWAVWDKMSDNDRQIFIDAGGSVPYE